MGLFDIFTKKKGAAKRNSVVPQNHAPRFQKRNTTGSAVSRQANAWYRSVTISPNKEIERDLPEVRRLSRMLCSKDALASNYIETLSVYVVGKEGIVLDPQVSGPDGHQDDRANDEIKRAWAKWGDAASLDGRMSWLDIQDWAIRTVAQDGEAFIRKVWGRDVNDFGFALQPIDANLVDVAYNGVNAINGNRIVNGIELGKYLRPVAYWIWNRYSDERDPSGKPRELQRVPADEVIHLFDPEAAYQLRGMPWITPVIHYFARLHEYIDAELEASQLASSIPYFITQNDQATDTLGDVTVSGGVAFTAPMDIDGMHTVTLDRGQDVKTIPFNHPNNAFDSFVKNIQHLIAAGVGVSYQTLTSDSGDANYSSGRLGSIHERERFQKIQGWFARSLHAPVYAEWIEAALLTDNLSPRVTLNALPAAKWRPKGFMWVDPLKDMKGYAEGIALGIYTKTQVVALMGGDYSENLRIRQAEQEAEQRLAVTNPESTLPPKTDNQEEQHEEQDS